jgi:hypothetical protein
MEDNGLTAYSRGIREKRIAFQQGKKFLPFYGTREFINIVATDGHWSLI